MHMRNSKAWYWKSAEVCWKMRFRVIPTYDSSAFEIRMYRSDPVWLEWAFVGVGIFFLLGLCGLVLQKVLIKIKLKQFWSSIQEN